MLEIKKEKKKKVREKYSSPFKEVQEEETQ